MLFGQSKTALKETLLALLEFSLPLLLGTAFLTFFGCSLEKTPPPPQVTIVTTARIEKKNKTEEAAMRIMVSDFASRLGSNKGKSNLISNSSPKRGSSLAEEINSFEAEDIYFDFDSDVIRPDAASVLRQKAAWLKKHPSVRILIEGHCDEWGSREYNLSLSKRRAESAKKFLVKLGVAPNRILTTGCGNSIPAVSPPVYCKKVKDYLYSRRLKPNSPELKLPPNLHISPEMLENCRRAWAKNRRCHFVVIKQ